MRNLLMVTGLISFAAFGAQWDYRYLKTFENEDLSITILNPHRYGPIRSRALICGGPGSVEFGAYSNKKRICKKFGYSSYVKNSVKYHHRAVLMNRAVTDRLLSGGWWCFGAPQGDQKGIKSLKCAL